MTQMAVTVLMLAAAALPAADKPKAPAPDYDAEYVNMKVPEQVTAGDIFSARVTMRNTGTKPWASWPLRLRTVGPENNTRWGTSYIIVRQGRTVEGGQEYTFGSRLRAPDESGEAAFQWQMCKDGKHFFGEKTPERTIKVMPRPKEPEPDEPAEDDDEKGLSFQDFEYVGSFKPPMRVGKARGAFSRCGLAVRRPEGKKPRLILNYTHPTQVLFEVEIPALVKAADGKHGSLPVTQPATVWGRLTAEREGMRKISPNGDFAWDDKTRTLYWTWYHGYKTGAAPPVLGLSALADDGTATTTGPWLLSVKSGLYKGYWGGAALLPADWAAKHTGGKRLALGFGGYYSICGSASRGPALGVVPLPKPEKKKVPVTELLYHPSGSPAPRDGQYFSANCGFWHNNPTSADSGTWTFTDHCEAGTFIDDEERPAYIVFTRMGAGRLGYDFGAITSAGRSAYWYVYDAADLAAAAAGEKKPTGITPSSMTRVRYPLGSSVTGACYDKPERTLYLCARHAYRHGRESFPVVHAYRLKE
jgi:hypothetical protein